MKAQLRKEYLEAVKAYEANKTTANFEKAMNILSNLKNA